MRLRRGIRGGCRCGCRRRCWRERRWGSLRRHGRRQFRGELRDPIRLGPRRCFPWGRGGVVMAGLWRPLGRRDRSWRWSGLHPGRGHGRCNGCNGRGCRGRRSGGHRLGPLFGLGNGTFRYGLHSRRRAASGLVRLRLCRRRLRGGRQWGLVRDGGCGLGHRYGSVSGGAPWSVSCRLGRHGRHAGWQGNARQARWRAGRLPLLGRRWLRLLFRRSPRNILEGVLRSFWGGLQRRLAGERDHGPQERGKQQRRVGRAGFGGPLRGCRHRRGLEGCRSGTRLMGGEQQGERRNGGHGRKKCKSAANWWGAFCCG